MDLVPTTDYPFFNKPNVCLVKFAGKMTAERKKWGKNACFRRFLYKKVQFF